MEDDWHFRTLSQAEFRSVEEDMIESIRRGTGRCVDYAQFLLGPFREWASVQQIRHVATVIPPVWTLGLNQANSNVIAGESGEKA